jgi:hypothetical protein
VIAAFKPSGNSGGTAPAITSANSTTFTVGTARSFTVTTTGSPTPALSESGTLPSGVTFTNNGNGTATLGGTPAAGTGGTYSLTITASNGVSPNATQSFTLVVKSIALVAKTQTFSTSPAIDTTGATLLVAFQAAGTFVAPTDSKNNTWTALPQQVSGAEKIGIYYVFNPTVGPGHTFTCKSTIGQTLFVSAWSGTLTTSGVFDTQKGFSTTNSANALQPGSITPAQSGELLVTNIITPQNDTESINSSFTIQDTQYRYSDFSAWAYLVDSSSSAINPTWTPSGITPGAAVIAAFKPR